MLPKWFEGYVGPHNETVQNPHTKIEVELTPEEVAMYDFIIGCEHYMAMMPQHSNDKSLHRDLSQAKEWFRQNNFNAYMDLID